MNPRLLLIALLLSACQAAAPPLAGARIGGPFVMTDQNGQRRTDHDYAGKYRIMYFGYTYCPDVCPVDVRNLAAGYRAFAKADPARAARVVPIFVSVDPGRDTPPILRDFTGNFAPFIGLVGTPAQTAAIATAYGVTYQIERQPGSPGYLVSHSRAAYLMDPGGKPVALLSQEAKPDVIAAELDKWVV